MEAQTHKSHRSLGQYRIQAAVILTLAALLCIGGGTVYYLYRAVHVPVSAKSSNFLVTSGSSLPDFTRALKKQGIVATEWPLQVWALISGAAGSLKAGEYRFETGDTAAKMLSKVVRGEGVQRKFTILEGWTFRDLRDALGKKKALKQVTRDLNDNEILDQLGIRKSHPEGLFFPDTYFFVHGHTDLDLLRRSALKMSTELQAAWAERAYGLPYDNPYAALIMASIVEKEALLDVEKPVISGVLCNRLRQGMRLQADPTVIYGLGSGFDGDLKRRHLRQDSPYNTYKRKGLPPTPIALPGVAALAAAVNPANTKAIYFVARGDGSHQFSATLQEHNAAVRTYQLK